jgi:RNA polymerase primary sigma factor
MSFETSENLPKYFKTIQKLNPLTVAEEKELAVRIQEGDAAALNRLVKHNLKIVVTIANRHIGQGVPIDDLIQEGNIGLFEAAQRFDPKSDARFITYASLWIRKRVNEAVVAHGRIVRLPHNQEYDIYKAKMAGEEIQNLSTVEIDAPIGEDGDTTIGDILLNTKSNIEFEIELDDVKYRAQRVLSHLKERDRKIIKAYFGIDGDYEMSPDVIAERFDLTNVRVCQIVKSALTKMKEVI